MNLTRLRARLETDPIYRARMREHYALHRCRFHADFDAEGWPERHHSRSNFFWGMALAGAWEALVAWQPTLNTPRARNWDEYRNGVE
jgi:hypothetical protein